MQLPWTRKITVVTHNGDFHADEVFALATLRLALKKPLSVLRTRDAERFVEADYVVDVGGEYDPDRNRFDHHQEGGAGERTNGIPYASFGLVWKKYGVVLCGTLEVANLIERKLVMPLDATDNGVVVATPRFQDIEPYNMEDLIYNLRPTWTEKDADIDAIFLESVLFAERVLKREIEKSKAKIDAEHFVEKIYRNTLDKRILVFEDTYPWFDAVRHYSEPLFIVCPRKADTHWNISTVRTESWTFQNRKDLPAAWAGKRDEELGKVTGVPEAVFCHNKRFLAVAKTKEAALKLAQMALKS